MSDIIEADLPRAKQASLFQQTRGGLIDNIEHREFVCVPFHTKAFYGETGPIIDVQTVGSGVMCQDIGAFSVRTPITAGSTSTVLFIKSYHPICGPALVENLSPASRGKQEWVSSEANNWARWTEMVRELLQGVEIDAKPAPSAAAKLRVERLARIQAALGLPTHAFAEVLRVSRPGLYKWLDASKGIALQEASRQRLAAVERLAKLWRERSNAPLNSVAHEPLEGGRTVLELLTADVLDEVAVFRAFDEAAAKLQGKPKSLSQRMAEAGFTRRPSHRSISDDE